MPQYEVTARRVEYWRFTTDDPRAPEARWDDEIYHELEEAAGEDIDGPFNENLEVDVRELKKEES